MYLLRGREGGGGERGGGVVMGRESRGGRVEREMWEMRRGDGFVRGGVYMGWDEMGWGEG